MKNQFRGNSFSDRDDVAAAVHALVEPLIEHFSPGRAGIVLGATGARHDQVSADMEAFARPLWGIVPLAAGGFDFQYWPLWREGLSNGCDPEHLEFWGYPQDSDQRLVELAAVGFALALVPEHIWDPLDSAAQKNISSFLDRAFVCNYPVCNWKFFRLMIGLGLQRTGHAIDTQLQKNYLQEIDSYYLGNGWYNDGKPQQVDHYIPFAFHYYGLILAKLSDDSDLANKFHQRAGALAPQLSHWYADDGAALPFGRSLSYRFSHAGFWGALAFSGEEALPWSQIKGLYLRNLRWWARQPIFDAGGHLSIGYAYPNLLMSEGYNAPGSPYWAMKAFLPLALPPEHAFWAAEEAPVSRTEAPLPLPEAAMVMQTLPGHQVALASGQQLDNMRHGAEKYAKFAYSTRYGFSIEVDERQFDEVAADNMIAFSDDGRHFRVRESNVRALIAGDLLYSQWRPFADVTVDTWLLPQGRWHIRVHQIHTPRRLQTIEGGFAIARPGRDDWQQQIDGASCTLSTASDVSTLLGNDHRRARAHQALPNSNLINARTLLPQLCGSIEAGQSTLACAVAAAPAGCDSPPAPLFPTVDELRRRIEQSGQPVLTPRVAEH